MQIMTREQEIHRLIFLKRQIMMELLSDVKAKLTKHLDDVEKLSQEFRELKANAESNNTKGSAVCSGI